MRLDDFGCRGVFVYEDHMPKGIGYGSKRGPFKVSDAKTSSNGSDRGGAVQSPYKPKDRIAKRGTRSRGRGR